MESCTITDVIFYFLLNVWSWEVTNYSCSPIFFNKRLIFFRSLETDPEEPALFGYIDFYNKFFIIDIDEDLLFDELSDYLY